MLPLHTLSVAAVQVEDRPVVKERVELVQEHRPMEKEFVVGSEGVGGSAVAATEKLRRTPQLAKMVKGQPTWWPGPLLPCPVVGGDACHGR